MRGGPVGMATEVELMLFAVFDPRLALQKHYGHRLYFFLSRREEAWSVLQTLWNTCSCI
jgi:hypothetical protein